MSGNKFELNHVVLTGNLTRDPELKSLPSGMSVCDLRIANNRRVKDQQTDEWRDVPNFFDVTVFGGLGENVARQCEKGSRILVEGELRWREWEAADGTKRQRVSIVAEKAIPVARVYTNGDGAQPQPTAAGGPATPPWGQPGDDIDSDIPF